MFLTRALLNSASFPALALPEQAAMLNVTLVGSVSRLAEQRNVEFGSGKSVVFHMITEFPTKDGNKIRTDHRIAAYRAELMQTAEKLRESDLVMMKGKIIGHKKVEMIDAGVKIVIGNSIVADTLIPIVANNTNNSGGGLRLNAAQDDDDDEEDVPLKARALDKVTLLRMPASTPGGSDNFHDNRRFKVTGNTQVSVSPEDDEDDF